MKSKSRRWLFLALAAGAAVLAAPQQASAADDFGRIVRHIETQYHVHRQHRFVMGFAGLVVKFYHFAGVKSLKGAIFENQPFLNAASDGTLDEIVRASASSGWQPMVQTWDRHTGERTYIYAQDLASEKSGDMKVLLVSLEPDEAVVLQLKMDPKKFDEFVRQASAGHGHRNHAATEHAATEEDAQLVPVKEPAAVQSYEQGWEGMCLLVGEP